MPQKNRIFAISKSQSIRQAPTKIPEEPSSLASPPRPAAAISRQSGRQGQISGWKARATFIRVHSCPFVVQRHPCVSFASSRLRVRPTAWKTPSPQRQSAGSQLQRADLGLESPSYLHSRSFAFIRGSFGKRWSRTPGHRTDQRSVVPAPTAGRTISVW